MNGILPHFATMLIPQITNYTAHLHSQSHQQDVWIEVFIWQFSVCLLWFDRREDDEDDCDEETSEEEDDQEEEAEEEEDQKKCDPQAAGNAEDSDEEASWSVYCQCLSLIR